jgi:muramoyltetrapeptide carboxypeptidase
MPVDIRAALDAEERTLSLLEPTVRPRAMTGPVG